MEYSLMYDRDRQVEPLMYDRQTELIAPQRTAHIIGCGGVGTWAAIMLALAGTGTIHLYDDDSVDESNLNRLPYSSKAIGKSKVDLLSHILVRMRPEIETVLHGRFNPRLHKLSGPVICAVDTIADRQGIYAACEMPEAQYIDAGAEAHSCSLSDSPADWSLVEDRVGYFTPIWVAPVVMAAAMAVSRAVYSSQGDIAVNLETMDIRRSRRT